MVQKYVFQICQKFAIASILVVLCCLPAAAQTSQANETLILNNKPITFAEFLKTYPNQAVRSKVLATLDEKAEDAFRDWEMARLKKHDAEVSAQIVQVEKERAEVRAQIVQVEKERAETNVALKLVTEMNTVLDELIKEQGASKPIMPEQLAINKNRATIIIAALNNPMVTSGLSSQALSILRVTIDNLQKGGNLTQLNIDLVKNVKTLPNK